MSKHTPGPWVAHVSKVDEDSGNEVMLIRSVDPLRGIASFEVLDEEDEANGRLIAAAPELLEALKLLQAIMSDSEGVAGYHRNGAVMSWGESEDLNPEIITALIKKAEGT